LPELHAPQLVQLRFILLDKQVRRRQLCCALGKLGSQADNLGSGIHRLLI